MTGQIIALLAFMAAFFAVVAANAVIADLTSRESNRLRERLNEQLRARQRDRVRKESVDFTKIATEALADREKYSILEKAQQVLEQSGLDMTWSRLVLLSITSGFIVLAVVAVAYSSFVPSLIAGAIGATFPFAYVALKRRQRLQKLREQLPDGLELMGRVLRSGQTIAQGMQAVADEFDRPLALEFLYSYEQMNMGLSAEVAMRALARRTGLLEIKIFVLAVLVQRQTGGNLAELLDKLGEVIRERFRIKGMIMSLTAQGRLQAAIMASLPPIMFAVLMVLNRDYMIQIFQIPFALVLSAALVVVGWLWANRIVNFDY